MEVKINVDDAKFNELFEKELDALTKEDITHIFEECVKEYFRKNDYEKIDNLIYEKPSYNGWGQRKEITTYVEKMIKECDMSKMQEIVDACIEEIKNNHDTLLKNVIKEAIVNGLMDSYSLHTCIRETVTSVLNYGR